MHSTWLWNMRKIQQKISQTKGPLKSIELHCPPPGSVGPTFLGDWETERASGSGLLDYPLAATATYLQRTVLYVPTGGSRITRVQQRNAVFSLWASIWKRSHERTRRYGEWNSCLGFFWKSGGIPSDIHRLLMNLSENFNNCCCKCMTANGHNVVFETHSSSYHVMA